MDQFQLLFRLSAFALLLTRCHCELTKDGKLVYQPNGNDKGCNGVAHGIPCCDQEFGFADGDNGGPREIFIQPSQYRESCINTCKILHPQSVGITESVRQQYVSGQGKNKNKCWCEFGRGKLNSKNHLYRTCMFTNAPPTYLMVVTSCERTRVEEKGKDTVVNTRCEPDKAQDQKMGRFTLQRETHNNKPVWKREHLLPEVYIFMSDRNHWGIGPNLRENLFGILSEDRPTPELPHLAGSWMFWDGGYWIQDKSILVLAGEKEDVGVEREIIMLDFKTVEVSNYSNWREDVIKVNESSDCCVACKSQHVITDKGFLPKWTALFNYDKKKSTCSCFIPMRYGTYGTQSYSYWGENYDVEKILLTRQNSGITSGLCDTDDLLENQRRSGEGDRRSNHPTSYHYSDVQGLLGKNRGFYNGNTHHLGSVALDNRKPHVKNSSCCQECRKEHPETEIYTYDDIFASENFGECHCYQVREGTRTVTKSKSYGMAGICEDIGPPVDCSVSIWSWTECSKTCGGGVQTRYALKYQVARRGGKPCTLEEQHPCSTEDCPL